MSDLIFTQKFDVAGGDFAAAGEVSAGIKQQLKKIGVSPTAIRKIAIASYEAELNMIIHSYGGYMQMDITPEFICLTCKDTGPGIPDIDLAMKEGYSTAPESVRMMGFGAGMGLPNINKNSYSMDISSSPAGTEIHLKFKME